MGLKLLSQEVSDLYGKVKYAYEEEGALHLIKKSYLGPMMVLDLGWKVICYKYLGVVEGVPPIEARKMSKKSDEIQDIISRKDEGRSDLLYKSIAEYADSPENVLSIGCHGGARLAHLSERGIEALHGVEINESAVETIQANHPDLYEQSEIHIGRAQEIVPTFDKNEFDVVYSISVLQLITHDAEILFDNIARVSNDLIVTIEVEDKDKPIRKGKFRNYREVFTKRGFKQVHEEQFWVMENKEGKKTISLSGQPVECRNKPQMLRVFKKLDEESGTC